MSKPTDPSGPSRRELVALAFASAMAPTTALAGEEALCDPPRYLQWIGRRERRWGEEIGPGGFVNYYGQPVPYDDAIYMVPDSYPTCRVWDTEASTFNRSGKLSKAIGARSVQGQPSNTNCQPWPSESQRLFETKVRALWEQVRDRVGTPDGTTRVCAVGSTHSSSDVYQRTDGGTAVCVHIEGLNQLLLDQPEWRPDFVRARADKAYALVAAGIQICTLNEALWSMGLAIETQGSFDGQTVAGAISTGTHGAGIEEGSVGDSVEAVIVLTCLPSPDGTGEPSWQVVQIEPNGEHAITDPARFRSERAGVPWRLVQDDDLFGAAVMAMGTMGIIVGYVMRVRKAYFLYEERVGRTWSEVRRNLPERAKGPPVGFSGRGWRYEIVVSPSPIRDTGEHAVTEVLRDAWDYDLNFTEEVRAIPQKWVGSVIRNVNLGGQVGNGVADLVNRGLVRGDRLGAFADRCYRVLKLGQGEFAQAWGTELMVPLDRATDMVDWVLKTNPERGRLQRGYRRNERLLNPFGVRFATGRRGLLTPVHWRRNGRPVPVCTCELTEPVKNSRTRNIGERDNKKPSAKRIVECWAEDFVKTFGKDARLHWGQVQGNTGEQLLTSGAYDQAAIDAWYEGFRTLNPFGLFDTAFAKRLGFVARRAQDRSGPRAYRGLGRPLVDTPAAPEPVIEPPPATDSVESPE